MGERSLMNNGAYVSSSHEIVIKHFISSANLKILLTSTLEEIPFIKTRK